jgi:hypothetical protein
MLKEPEGLLDGPGAFEEPTEPVQPRDFSQDIDFVAWIAAKAKEDAIREREAQIEAEAIHLCEGIDGVILPYIKPEHCIPGVTVGSRISRLSDEDWDTFNRAKTFCLRYGANAERGRWPLSAHGVVAFYTNEAKTNDDPDHLRKVRNAISRVTRALLDPTEQPVVRATLARLCERTDEDNKPNEKDT